MGIYDREYLRDDTSTSQAVMETPFCWTLVGLLGVAALIDSFAAARGEFAEPYAMAWFESLRASRGEVWRYLTYLLLPAGPFEMLLAILSLVIVGRAFERRVGSIVTMLIFFLCGALGAIACQLSDTWNLFGMRDQIRMYSPSPGTLAIMAAAFVAIPRVAVTLYFPSTTFVELRMVAAVGVVITFLLLSRMPMDRPLFVSGFTALLAGAAAGWLVDSGARPSWSVFGSRPRARKPQRKVAPPREPVPSSDAHEEDDVDDLLKKISEEGLSSLTDAERKRLEAASARRRRERT